MSWGAPVPCSPTATPRGQGSPDLPALLRSVAGLLADSGLSLTLANQLGLWLQTVPRTSPGRVLLGEAMPEAPCWAWAAAEPASGAIPQHRPCVADTLAAGVSRQVFRVRTLEGAPALVGAQSPRGAGETPGELIFPGEARLRAELESLPLGLTAGPASRLAAQVTCGGPRRLFGKGCRGWGHFQTGPNEGSLEALNRQT